MTFPFPFLNVASEERDPFFSNVQMLLHGDGPNGSTVIVDSSPAARTFTKWGGTIDLDTGQSKFGGSSIRFVNGGMYNAGAGIALPGDFTIEGWFRLSSVYTGVICDFRGAGNSPSLWVYQGSVVWSADGVDYSITSGSIVADTWYHIAVSRISGQTRLFVDGTNVGVTYASATSYDATANTPSIGVNSPRNATYSGWMDDFRITAGVGRYAANFAVPTKPFPDK